ncbi:MAG: carboxypeptidase-like regulatory domain-containing protein, partial [Ktedonobacteraceae bacterium]
MKLITGSMLLLLVASPIPLVAQAVANAQIHGDVTDQSGGIIPNAQISATQTNTGQARTTTSNSAGIYVLPNLPVGPYSIQVTSHGFQSYVQSGIVLQVGDNIQDNVTLQVGAVSQKVQVTASAQMVQTQSTSVSTVVDQRRIVDLPLNGRHATSLILLAGGTVEAPDSSRVTSSHDFPTAVGISVA